MLGNELLIVDSAADEKPRPKSLLKKAITGAKERKTARLEKEPMIKAARASAAKTEK